ncbi:uncharacterized protein LOC142354918 [Convolutriloba macropyga]|uniref:uncharacterized protein LOC142354918 n=1 Tax=Convolutriloba macropyga TaxID=536237 RepID=UPI003F52525D
MNGQTCMWLCLCISAEILPFFYLVLIASRSLCPGPLVPFLFPIPSLRFHGAPECFSQYSALNPKVNTGACGRGTWGCRNFSAVCWKTSRPSQRLQLPSLPTRLAAKDRIPRWDVDQIVSVASKLEPELMAMPVAKPHLTAMLGLGRSGVTMDATQLKTELKACRDAHKQAKAVFRQLEGTPDDRQTGLQRGMEYAGPASDILKTMGEQMREKNGTKAFQPLPREFILESQTLRLAMELQGYDKDGSGRLEQNELCKVARELNLAVSGEELRFFLAFTLLSDSTRDGALSLEETQAMLEPFMGLPGDPAIVADSGKADNETSPDGGIDESAPVPANHGAPPAVPNATAKQPLPEATTQPQDPSEPAAAPDGGPHGTSLAEA